MKIKLSFIGSPCLYTGSPCLYTGSPCLYTGSLSTIVHPVFCIYSCIPFVQGHPLPQLTDIRLPLYLGTQFISVHSLSQYTLYLSTLFISVHPVSQYTLYLGTTFISVHPLSRYTIYLGTPYIFRYTLYLSIHPLIPWYTLYFERHCLPKHPFYWYTL